MTMIGPELERLRARLRARVIEAARRHDLSARALAEIGGVSEPLTRGYLRDGWEPSDTTLRRLEAGLDAAGAFDPALPVPVTDLVVGARRRIGPSGLHAKVYLASKAARLDPQLAQVLRYCTSRRPAGRRGDARVHEADVGFGTLSVLAPDCAVHVYAVADDPMDTTITRWQRVPGFRGGTDFTGMRFREDPDGTLAACLAEDAAAAADAGWPIWTVLRRQALWRETGEAPDRCFLRVLIPLVGEGDAAKVLSVRRLQEARSPLQLLEDLRPVRPDQGQGLDAGGSVGAGDGR